MSLKDRLAELLFGAKQQEETETEAAPAQEEPAAAETPEFLTPSGPSPTLLELPQEHAIHQLYNLRRKESGYLPAPRLCLDEDGALSEEIARRELSRLRTVVTSQCSARLKQLNRKGRPQGKADKKKEAMADEPPPVVLDALPCFFLSADKLWAWVFVLPPAGGGAELSRDLLDQALAKQGISYGLDAKLADRLSHEEARYFHLHLIAQGKPAFDGSNGNIVDYFPRSVDRVLQVDEYDRVDYTALNLIHNVKEGEAICRLVKHTEGEPGRTVLNEEIPAKSGKPVPLPKGRNTEISEDGILLLATISGDVEFTGHSFQVKPVLDIQGNVDFSTGNINFLGDVNIRGDVLSGFTVRAMGNVQVAGVVEAGSSVEAGGDLIVVKGILGDGSAIIRSHRSLFSKYIENSTIYVRENLQTDCVINSQIYSDGEVVVRSGRGTIIGGRIWAAKKITAIAVGARSECRTSVALGGLPCTNFEREIVQREMEDLEMELEKLECQPDSTGRSSLLEKARAKLTVAELKLKQLDNELAELKVAAEEKNDGRLECGIAYPGTEITFGDETYRVRQESRQCVAVMVHGEIVLM